MAQLIALPDQRKPNNNVSPASWWVHTASIKWTGDSRSNVSTITAHGSSVSSTTNPGGSGSIYTSSDGFKAKVNSSSTNSFYSMHYFGATGGLSFSSLNDNQTASTSNKACFIRDVTGFICEVNGAPTINGDFGSSGDSANDNCGVTRNISVYGVYVTPSRKTKILKFTDRGSKVHTSYINWNSTLTGSWQKFGYVLNSSDASLVVNSKLMLMGWVFRVEHKKTCGGGNKNKNMAFRLRYTIPLISSAGTSFSLQETGYPWQLVMPPDTPLSTAVNGLGGTAGSAGPGLFVK